MTTQLDITFEEQVNDDDMDNPEVLHARWVVACGQVQAAYDHWCAADARSRDDRYAALVAMMDQEATAAVVYARAAAATDEVRCALAGASR